MNTVGFYESQKKDNFLLLRIVAASMVIYGHSFALTKDIGLKNIFCGTTGVFIFGDGQRNRYSYGYGRK